MRRKFVLTYLVVLQILLAGCIVGNPSKALGLKDQNGGEEIEFEEVSASVGFNYTSTDSLRPSRGGGVYVTDFNNDGWPDVLVLGGSPVRAETTDYLNRKPILFENTGGEFAPNRSAFPTSTLPDRKFLGAVFFDYDGDGWEDLLLFPDDGRPVFFANEDGRFKRQDVGFDTRLTEPVGASVADFDRDGHLDVFVIQNGDWKERKPRGYNNPNVSVEDDNGNPNVLFDGNGSSFDRASEAGITGTRWSLATSFVDLTGNGYPDIHVANDYNNDVLYVNRGEGRFEQVELGEATDRNGMSSEVADFNQDGRLDVFVTNIYFNRSNLSGPGTNFIEHILGKRMAGNSLLLNRGDGEFVDRAAAMGVRKGGWGWAAVATDFDNNGDIDLMHSSRKFSATFAKQETADYSLYPVLFEQSEGTYQRRSPEGVGFEPSNGLGVVRLDFDRDGDQDLIVAQQNGVFQLYENRGAGGNWLQVRIAGETRKNALGAEVYVSSGNETQYRVVSAKADFASQDSRVIHFGLGDAKRADSVRVVWPDGTTETFSDIDVNRRIVISPSGIQTVGHNRG